jgi:hypothetical protein
VKQFLQKFLEKLPERLKLTLQLLNAAVALDKIQKIQHVVDPLAREWL